MNSSDSGPSPCRPLRRASALVRFTAPRAVVGKEESRQSLYAMSWQRGPERRKAELAATENCLFALTALSNWSLKLLLLVTPALVLLMIRREREGNGFSYGEKHHRYCKDLAAAAATLSSLPKAFSRLCRCCCCGGGSSGKVLWKCWNSTDKRGVVAVPAAAAIDAAVCSALHPLLSPLFLFLHRRRRRS